LKINWEERWRSIDDSSINCHQKLCGLSLHVPILQSTMWHPFNALMWHIGTRTKAKYLPEKSKCSSNSVYFES